MKSMKEIFLRLLKTRIFRAMYWMVGVFFLFLFIMDSFVMPWYVNKGGTLTVPNVVGLKEETARKLLDSLHLEPKIGDTRPDNTYPVGYVVAQNPEPQQVVKTGRRIYLTISGGEQLVVVPSLRGKTIRDSKFTLDRIGLNQGGIQYQTSLEFPEGTIMAQDIPPGSKVKRGTYIGITISAGESIDSIYIPSLIGKTLTEAQKILRTKGLRVGNIIYQVNEEMLPNTIIDQLPRENEIVTTKKEVDLFVAQAPEKRK
ncbi:MAG: PASTA domain-containing protein [Bacteroidota bacterium]